MANNKENKKRQENIDARKAAMIQPEDIIVNAPVSGPAADDDSDMPQPETKQYKVFLKLTPKFMQLFGQCVNNLPYRTVFTNTQGKQMPLPKLVQFIEQNHEKISRDDMNYILSFIDNFAFVHVRPLMDAVGSGKQEELWSAFEG